MKTLPQYWVAGLLICQFPFVEAAGPPPQVSPFTAIYQISRNNLPFGRSEVTLERGNASGYTYSASTRPDGFIALFRSETITEISRGKLQDSQVTPLQYRYNKAAQDRSRTIAINFNWKKIKATTHSGDSTWSMSIPVGTQDKFSQQLATRLALAEGKQKISFNVADGGKLKRYRYEVEKSETLSTAIGRLETLRVKRYKQEASADYTIWFATELEYLPVRFEREQSDGFFVIEIAQLKR